MSDDDAGDGEWSTFPPGPRWYLAIFTEREGLGVQYVEGTESSTVHELKLVGASLIYVFGKPTLFEEIDPVIRGMFAKTGPTILDAFRDRIEKVYTPRTVSVARTPRSELNRRRRQKQKTSGGSA